MLRSLYSGISGMKVNQTKLDVTGNNIANVGTTAFKGSRVRFQDMLSQNVSEALGPGRNTGGVNARQVGLGVQVAGIDTVVTQGMMQPTSRNLDVAVDGAGYFVVARGEIPESNAGGSSVDSAEHTISGGNFEISYTRDGAFTLDYQGNLLTSDGYRVMGYDLSEKTDATGNTRNVKSIDYSSNGTVNFVDSEAKYGLKASGTLVPLRIPDSVHVNPSIINTGDEAEAMAFMGSGKKEDITTAPTIDTNGLVFKGSSNLKIEVKHFRQEDESYIPMVLVNGEKLLDEEGAELTEFTTEITNEVIAAHFMGKNRANTAYTEDDATMDAEKLLGREATINIGEPELIDGAELSKFSWSFTLNAETDKKIRSFSIEKDGVIKAVLDDGSVSALGQLGMSSFKNPEGLKKLGKNLYQNTANSGEPIVRSGIGEDKYLDNSDGYGDMLQGMLEMSNVDLSEQFTDMIVTTRAFQAAGKMITTGDEILQDIINLKR